MNRLRVQAVIFDNDGVLTDSSAFIIERHQRVARELGLRVPNADELRKHFGKHWEQDFLPIFWPRDHERMRVAYLVGYDETTYPTFPGLITYVKALHDVGIPLAVVTNRDRGKFFGRFERTGFDPRWFTVIQTADVSAFRKPDPRVFTPILKTLGMNADATVYVGDALDDFRAARDAGMHFIAVTTGALTIEEFLAAGVPEKYILASPSDLPNILEPMPRNNPHRV